MCIREIRGEIKSANILLILHSESPIINLKSSSPFVKTIFFKPDDDSTRVFFFIKRDDCLIFDVTENINLMLIESIEFFECIIEKIENKKVPIHKSISKSILLKIKSSLQKSNNKITNMSLKTIYQFLPKLK